MSLLENFNLVYGNDMRILDPSVEVNALTGIGPQFHLEPFHTMRWVGDFEGSSSVMADHQSIAFRGHKTETMIPHIPIPPWPFGAPLLRTILLDSKCHIYCHNPDIEIEGNQVGIALIALAPPFHCASLQVPATLGKLGSLGAKIPGLSRVKGALGKLHKINHALARFDEVSSDLHKLLEGARVAQVLGCAVVDALDAMDEKPSPQHEASGECAVATAEHPFHTSQEMLRADADYQKARLALNQGDKADAVYYQHAQEIKTLEESMHRTQLDLRKQLHERQVLDRHRARLDERIQALDKEVVAHDLVQAKIHGELRLSNRRARLGVKTEGIAKTHDALERGAKVQRLSHDKLRRLRCEHERSTGRLRSLQEEIQSHRAQLEKNQQRRSSLRSSQREHLASLAPSPTHKQLGVMLPSLTSFSASFMQHSVKTGMSPASYWGMQLRVVAIAMSEIINHAIGLVGDALLVDGPTSRVGAWVAELGAGALQGAVGSSLRAWGGSDRIDFSVPIKTGTLVAGGLVQARAEFYWSLSEDTDQEVLTHLGHRTGTDLPGRDFDSVQLFGTHEGPGVDFTIPTVW